jgi:hypothetical protein
VPRERILSLTFYRLNDTRYTVPEPPLPIADTISALRAKSSWYGENLSSSRIGYLSGNLRNLSIDSSEGTKGTSTGFARSIELSAGSIDDKHNC